MTISFYYNFRNEGYVFNLVMDKIISMGYQDLTLAPSSLTGVMNDKVIEAIKKGVITNITSSGMRGSLGDFVSHGGLKNPVIFRSHGNRARSIEEGEIKVDRSEEHTSELQSRFDLVCRLLLEKKKV